MRFGSNMQWYVFLITITATTVLGWVGLEILGRPIRAFFDLRRKVREQTILLGNISLPKPRETAVSSREIREYDQAVRNLREAQRIFRDLGSQMLAFGENEPAARNTLAAMGLDLLAAGGGLIELSVAYSQPDGNRAGLRNQIEKALRLTNTVPASSRQRSRHNNAIEYQTNFVFLRNSDQKASNLNKLGPARRGFRVPGDQLSGLEAS